MHIYSLIESFSFGLADVFRNFFTEHAEAFEGAPAMCSGEHDLKYYNLFQIYLKLYEVCLKLIPSIEYFM